LTTLTEFAILHLTILTYKRILVLSIIIDSVGGIVEALGRDFFMEDYVSVEELIKEIEQYYTLSKKEKERLTSIFNSKEREEFDLD
jgi:hypothetical protein